MNNLFKNFFLFCSGATVSILKKSPTEQNKYVGIGATIFFTGMLAALSGGYALYTVFESWEVALAFGLFWGMIIFNLDRLVVSGIKKKGFFVDLVKATPRLALAGVLAIVISAPLELKIFEKEIEVQLQAVQTEKVLQMKASNAKEFDQIEKLEANIAQLKEEISVKQKERDAAYNRMIAEAEGTAGTGISGKGPLYKEKRAFYEKAEADLNAIRAANMATLARLEKKIDNLYEQKESSLSSSKEVVGNYDGFLARFEALEKLTAENQALANAKTFISILFVLIETAPMLVKLMAPRGPYDDMLERMELSLSSNEKQEVHKLETELKDQEAKHTMYSHAKKQMLKHSIKDWTRTQLALTEA